MIGDGMKKKIKSNKKLNSKIIISLIILTVLSVTVGYIIYQSSPKYMNSPSKENCSIGYYYSAGFLFFSKSGCQICPSGKYCSGDNKYHDCKTPGTKTIGEGRTGEKDCKYCKDDTKYLDGTCKPCKQGYYCQGGYLNKCPSGKTTKTTGNRSSSACVCKAGTYASGSSCKSCPSGFTSEIGITSIGQCTKVISAGNYIECNNSKCTVKKCTGNTISAKQTVKYSKNLKTKCNTTCSGDKVANDSHTACVCKAGTYASGNSCKKCPSGFTSSKGATSINQCTGTVPAGKSIVCTTSGCSVKSCTGNSYAPKRTVKYSTSLVAPCYSCIGEKTVNANHSACVCKSGTYASGNKCVACPKCNGGTTCFSTTAGATSISQCTGLVPAGKYITCSGSGCTTKTCPGNTYSIAHTASYKSGLNTSSNCKSCGNKKANSTHTGCI